MESMEREDSTPARRHVLVQATVPPLDEDGRVAGLVGTLAFAVALLVITIRDGMTAAGVNEVNLWIAMCGLGVGLLFLGFCELRAWQRRGRDNSGEDGAAEPAESPLSPSSPADSR